MRTIRSEYAANRALQAAATRHATTIPPLAMLYVRKARAQRRRDAMLAWAYRITAAVSVPALFIIATQ